MSSSFRHSGNVCSHFLTLHSKISSISPCLFLMIFHFLFNKYLFIVYNKLDTILKKQQTKQSKPLNSWGLYSTWPPHVKSWLIGKDSDAGRDWGQEEKGMTETEDEMARWHHRLDGRECEWAPGDGDGQGGLACCNSWGHKESDTTEQLNWTELKERLHTHTPLYI